MPIDMRVFGCRRPTIKRKGLPEWVALFFLLMRDLRGA